jgi:hypothetical protein
MLVEIEDYGLGWTDELIIRSPIDAIQLALTIAAGRSAGTAPSGGRP